VSAKRRSVWHDSQVEENRDSLLLTPPPEFAEGGRLEAIPELPVIIRILHGAPLIFTGGLPATGVNVALSRRIREGSSIASVKTYASAWRLFFTYCALTRCSIAALSDPGFAQYKSAVQGRPFRAHDGSWAVLPGERGARTSDHHIACLYGLGGDIEDLYGIAFPWRRYVTTRWASQHYEPWAGPGGRPAPARRKHRIRHANQKTVGLPDEQFEKLLERADRLWGWQVADGDRAFSVGFASATDALYRRNLALLLVLRFTGARRSEVPTLDIADIDRTNNLLWLETKGRPGKAKEPVVLLPAVRDALWDYLVQYRAVARDGRDESALFVSHSTRNYGHRISDQTVRKVLDAVRAALDEPWRTTLHPHQLRHSWGYDLQRLGGTYAVRAGLRHRSVASADAYAAGPEVFAAELAAASQAMLDRVESRRSG
jgi:integrase